MNAEQRKICRALLARSYSDGFDSHYPLVSILEECGIPLDVNLYDENTETGILWGLSQNGNGALWVLDRGNGQYAAVNVEMRDLLENWSREP